MSKKRKLQITTTLIEEDVVKLREISKGRPINLVLGKWINLSDNNGNIIPSRSLNFSSRGNPIDNMVSAINLVCPGYFNDVELMFSNDCKINKSEKNKIIFLNNFETLDICADKVFRFFIEDYIEKGFYGIDKTTLKDRVNKVFETINALEV